MTRLAVQIVSRERLQQTVAALTSVLKHTETPFDVHLWDNGSGPGMQTYLREHFRDYRHLRMTFTGENIGYGPAHNEMVKQGDSEFIAVLTNDVIMGPSWASALLAPFRGANVGQSSPVHIFSQLTETGLGVPPGGVPDPALRQRLGRMAEYCDGSCFIVPRSVVRERGFLFDPMFGLGYSEDADLSLWLRSKGRRIVQVPIRWRRDESAKTPINVDRKALSDGNNRKLLERWGSYLKTRRFA